MGRIDPSIDKLACPQLHMVRDFVAHLLFNGNAPEKRTETLANAHDGTRILLTAAANAAQASVSLVSCWRPLRVRR